jgi:hypothetical protein
MTDNEFQVISGLFSRYEALVIINRDILKGLPNKCNYKHLQRLCHEAAVNGRQYPFDKMCRWLGFVQGILAVKGIIDVDAEREYTRPLFHSLYDSVVPTF